jgi:hypothetical protein
MLYVGATLMIGASIYGFVDYKNTSRKKEFTSMYEEKKAPVVTAEDKVAETVVSKDRDGSIEKKAVTKKQLVSQKEEATIAAVSPIAEEDRIAVKETREIEKTTVDVKTSRESNVIKKVKKKKKLNSRLFSRAPLREEEEIILPGPVKEDAKKIEKKEQ